MEIASSKKKSYGRKTLKGSKQQSTDLLEASIKNETQEISNSKKKEEKEKGHHGKTVKDDVKDDNHQPIEPVEASDEGDLDPCVKASKRKRKYSEKPISSDSGQCCKKQKVHHSERSKKQKRKKQSREAADNDGYWISKRHKKHKTVHKGKVDQLIL